MLRAQGKILEERINNFYNDYVITLLEEARKLGIGTEDLISMIRKGECSHEC